MRPRLLGELRWRPPQPHGPWQGVLEAFNFGSDCTQPGSSPDETAGSEDCLFLNIYRPHRRSGDNPPGHLPVMVWMHGGALTILSGAFDVPTTADDFGAGESGLTWHYTAGRKPRA